PSTPSGTRRISRTTGSAPDPAPGSPARATARRMASGGRCAFSKGGSRSIQRVSRAAARPDDRRPATDAHQTLRSEAGAPMGSKPKQDEPIGEAATAGSPAKVSGIVQTIRELESQLQSLQSAQEETQARELALQKRSAELAGRETALKKEAEKL